MSTQPTRRHERPSRGVLAGVGTVAALAVAAIGWQAITNDDTAEREPVTRIEAEPREPSLGNGFEWIVTEPAVDLAELADVHASSRLQYDECQQDYREIASEPSSGRHPLYFC